MGLPDIVSKRSTHERISLGGGGFDWVERKMTTNASKFAFKHFESMVSNFELSLGNKPKARSNNELGTLS